MAHIHGEIGPATQIVRKDQALRSATLASRAPSGRRAERSDNVIDSTKSEIRGAISARKREPLNTP
jgi:hypothetical protein